MANAWGELSWSQGNFGEQNNITVPVTGIGGNPIAWGSSNFGSSSFGGVSQSIPLSLAEETVTGEINAGWGRLEWGENAWGIAGDVIVSGIGLSTGIGLGTVTATADIDITGQQQNITLASPNIIIATEIFLDENPLPNLTIANGTVDAAPDAEVTGNQLNTGLGSLTVYNEQGWGRDRWGVEEWGAEGIWEEVQLNNTNLGLGVTSGVRETWGQNEWGATTTEWGGSAVTEVGILTIASPTGIQLTAEEGIVDPSPDATVIGIGLTASVALGSVVEADANVTINGIGLEIAQGQAELDANTIASITGQQLNISLNNAIAGASAEVPLTGIGLTVSVNSINVQSWQIVNTGSNVTWNIIDTAA